MGQEQTCDYIINGLDQLLTIADENYSDISQFLEDPEKYLEDEYNFPKKDKDALYTAPISTGGDAFLSIDKACMELVKVNAYTEALYIYQTFMDHLESLKDGLSKDDTKNIEGTINAIKHQILSTMKERDDYMSNRKSILAKYSAIVKNIK